LGGGIGLGYASLKKPDYTAACTFVLEESNATSSLGQYSGIASMVGIDLGGGGGIFQSDNIVELYKSRTMIEKALLSPLEINSTKQLLLDRYITFNNLRDRWSNQPELNDLRFNITKNLFTRTHDSIIGVVVDEIKKDHLKVSKLDKKLSIIKVEVKVKDEIFAKAFNDNIVKNVNDFYVETKTKKSLQNVQILQRKTDSVRAVMNGEIYRAVAVSDATPNLNPTRQIQRVAPMQKSQFSVETNKLILEELIKNLEMSKVSLRMQTPLIQRIDAPVFPLEKEKISKLFFTFLGIAVATVLIVLYLLVRKVVKSSLA
jgi:hypothetical protein